jgi:hypothetical protein
MRDRRLSRTRWVSGILLLLAVAFGAVATAGVATAAENDPNGDSSMGIVVTVPVHSVPPTTTPTPTPTPTTTTWPPATHDPDADAGPAGPDDDGWLSDTGLGWQTLAFGAAAVLVTALGALALRRSRRRA